MDHNNRCPTGVSGLDDILEGGLPRNRLYLLEGDPGAGKTTLALQFLLEGVRSGEKGLYITLSETKEELDEVASSHGWSLDGLAVFELSAMQQQLNDETDSTFFHPSDLELNRTTEILVQLITREKPDRLVFDSLSELRLLAETPLRHRRQILDFKQFFAGRNCTVLFLDDRTGPQHADTQIRSIAHGVLALDKYPPDYGVTRRNLNVVKIRGVKFREGAHDYSIQKGGIVIFPRLRSNAEAADFKPIHFPSGIEGLDSLLGGGLDRGTSSLIMGPPGTGKSTLALRYTYAAATRGENVEFYAFDEAIGTLVARARSLGMGIDEFLRSGRVTIYSVNPAEISPGELTYRIQKSVETKGARMVVIDSLNGYLNAMPQERFLNLQLHETLHYLNQQGVLTLMVLAQAGIIGNMQSIVDLTYLADTVILMRYYEARGSVKQAISVIKKRSGNHERTIREFSLDAKGIRVGPPMTQFHGVLTGVPQITSDRDGEKAEKSRESSERDV